MIVYVLHFGAGETVAARLAETLGGEAASIPAGKIYDAFAERWSSADAFVFVGALAIAVRAVAPLISDKTRDPALVVVTEDGGVCLPVIGGHAGGATDLARRCADILSDCGAVFTPTASSDRAGRTAPDLWAARRGYAVLFRPALVPVIRKLVDKGEIAVWTDPILPEHEIALPLPACYTETGRAEDADLIISPRHMQKIEGAKPQIVPRVITAGVGCRAGIPGLGIERAITGALLVHPGGPFLKEALWELRTVTAKKKEPGLIEASRLMGVPLRVLSDDEVMAVCEVGDFSPSPAQRHLGLPGVAEPCAASAGELLGPRAASGGVTVALSITGPDCTGAVTVVGSGPGDARYITSEARETIAASDVVVGYRLYVDLLPQSWLAGKIVERYGMGEEELRVEQAMSYAERGYHVSLVCGGDPVLFGLGALALQTALAKAGAGRCVPTRVVPGITAAQAAGVAIGAPYANGLALLSLSDYLQPWTDVVRAMEGAESSGLTIALYNPVKRGLENKLAEVRRVFAARRAILVRDAGRPGASVRELAVSELTADEIDMRTLILFPSAKTREIEPHRGSLTSEKICDNKPQWSGGKIWLEARGYRAERPALVAPQHVGQFLVLGGTTEGRVAAETVLGMGYSVTTSVSRDAGRETVPEGSGVLIGGRGSEDWKQLFSSLDERPLGVIDATHPFAEEASHEIAQACAAAAIPICRFLRPGESVPDSIPAASPEEAAGRAIDVTAEGETVFLATGVRMLGRLLPPLREAGRGVAVRMLPTEESMTASREAGLSSREIVAVWGHGSAAFNEELFRERGVKAVITKASGREGGVPEKAAAASKLGIPLIIIERPADPEGTRAVASAEELAEWCESLAPFAE